MGLLLVARGLGVVAVAAADLLGHGVVLSIKVPKVSPKRPPKECVALIELTLVQPKSSSRWTGPWQMGKSDGRGAPASVAAAATSSPAARVWR